ncbi:MAG: VanZ family protein [Clostridia bacterium]|nr:VanZ family protein [Clostridia bacterium]
MQDIINNTTPIEIVAILLTFSAGYIFFRKNRKRYLFIYSIALIVYTTLLRRTPGILERSARIAQLEFVGFNLSGFLLNVLLFLPLGFSLKKCQWWLPFILSMVIEVTQQITHLGMFDVWDIVANTFGGLLGCLVANRSRVRENNKGAPSS